MADELTTQSTQELEAQNKESEAQRRINQLSEKVRLTSEERDEIKRLADEKDAKLAETSRERDFFAGFSDMVATNPSAKDHKDDILAKVKGGYTVEDATYAVLGKAGKLGSHAQAPQSPAGGSSDTTISQGGSKSAGEMTQAERRAMLEKELFIS